MAHMLSDSHRQLFDSQGSGLAAAWRRAAAEAARHPPGERDEAAAPARGRGLAPGRVKRVALLVVASLAVALVSMLTSPAGDTTPVAEAPAAATQVLASAN